MERSLESLTKRMGYVENRILGLKEKKKELRIIRSWAMRNWRTSSKNTGELHRGPAEVLSMTATPQIQYSVVEISYIRKISPLCFNLGKGKL